MKKTALGLAIALGAASGSASALTVDQILDLTPNFTFEDGNVEWLVDINSNGTLDEGDYLEGIIEFPKIFGAGPNTGDEYTMGSVSGATGVGPNSSLSAYFKAEVFSKTNIQTVDGVERADYVFAPIGSFAANSILTGTMVSVYEQALDNININNCGATLAACISSVTDGTKIVEIGFTGDPYEAWEATEAPTNPNLRAFDPALNFGSFNYALNTVSSTIGSFSKTQAVAPDLSTAGPGAFTEWAGGGSPKGALGILPVGVLASSNGTLTASRIPEPATLGLLGLGLLGMAGLRRRKSV